MARRGPQKAPRGPKSSKFLGVKKRGGCISVDMRCAGRHWEVSGFATEEHAALAHDFFKSLSRKAANLNFPNSRELLVQFSEQHGMERFKVVSMEEEKSWADEKKKEFLDLMEKAHNGIKSAETASAVESLEGAEGARVQQLATVIFQGSNDDVNRIRTDNKENVDWDIEGAFPSSEGSCRWFCSRESESAICSRIAELEARIAEREARVAEREACVAEREARVAEREARIVDPDALLSAETEKDVEKDVALEMQYDGLQAQNKHLMQQTRRREDEQIVVRSGVDWSSSVNGTGIINTGCGSWGCDILANSTPGSGCNVGLTDTGAINISFYASEGFGVETNISEWNPDG